MPFKLVGRLLLALVVCYVLCEPTTAIATPLTSGDCAYPHLPTNFDSISYLGFNEEFHSHNTYYYDFSSQIHNIKFTVKQQTAIRIYFAPHVVDIDVWLYTNDTHLIKYTIDTHGDEVIMYTAQPGSYYFSLIFYGIYNVAGLDCPTITMEAVMTPTSRLASRVATEAPNCRGQLMPTLTFPASMQTFLYDSSLSGVTFNVQYPSDNMTGLQFIQSYPFSLPRSNPDDVYSVVVTVGNDFLTGGSLGLLLVGAGYTPNDLSCLKQSNCTLGVHYSAGENTLKTSLRPGDYVLWIFDDLNERNMTLLSTCLPFSFRMQVEHALQEESLLNCPYEELTSTFNSVGNLDADGFLYFRERLLVTSQPHRDVDFRLSAISYFRAYTTEHRIDIDLKLINKDSGATVAYAYQWGGEEGLVARLQPNINYQLQVVFFGTVSPIFCENYLLEVAISPVSLYNSTQLCSGVASTPDLTALPAELAASRNFTYGTGQVFRFDYNGNYAQRQLLVQNFTITTASYIKAELGANFLIGDIRVWLQQWTQNGPGAIQSGEHHRNMHYMDSILSPGDYTLLLYTGDTQDPTQSGYPPCSLYSFFVEIQPATATVYQECLPYHHFPRSLNTPQFLGSAPKLHIQELFLVPFAAGMTSTSRETDFIVATSSYFRLYIAAHVVDIDIQLFENGISVVSGITFNEEEAISFTLKPNASYKLTTKFYFWAWNGPFDAHCYTYSAELAIEPIVSGETNASRPCAPDSLPVSSLIPLPSTTAFNLDQTYRFTQTARSRQIDLSFMVPAGVSALFRAEIEYDFVWSDLSLLLRDSSGNNLAESVIGYNREEIYAVSLAPGNYTLRVYEAFPTGELRACVEFQLIIAFQARNSNDGKVTLQTCPEASLPATFNSVPFLSNITGNILHFSRGVLLDVVNKNDYVEFTPAVPSVFRIYVPNSLVVDVDIVLYHGTKATPGQQITSRRGYEDETIRWLLDPKPYFIQFIYYSFTNGPPLPPATECTTFPAIITIYPVEILQQVPGISSSCISVDVPPQQLAANTNFIATYTRPLDVSNWQVDMSFSVTKTSTLLVNLRYEDEALGLAMRLIGTSVSRINTTYHPIYEANHAYLYEVIPAGSYVLSIREPSALSPDFSVLKCAQYELQYFLDTSANSTISCETIDILPIALAVPSDGSIRFYAEKLLAPKDASKKHHYLSFTVRQASFMRTFVSADQGTDIDFYLYKRVNETGDFMNAIYMSLGVSSTESALWELLPQDEPYVLDINFFRVSTARDCNFFQFELAIKRNTTVRDELLCPAPLPNDIYQVPLSSIDLTNGLDRAYYRSDYMFTSTRIAANSRYGTFTYGITLTVGATMIVSGLIGYDFLANDFRLTMYDSHNTILAQGEYDAAVNRDGYINFFNSVSQELTNGTYYLNITEFRLSNQWGNGQYCHYFSFDFLAYRRDKPKILAINPAYASDLDPNADLSISVSFSEAVNVPEEALLSFIRSNVAIVLRDVTTNVGISPYVVTSHTGGSVIQVLFDHNLFVEGGFYRLYVNASVFRTTSGEAFTASNYYNYYSLHVCNCHGKGDCVQLHDTWACKCVAPWAGDQCDLCAPGYHAAGTSCALNSQCVNNSCNGHGRCSDELGYTSCRCDTGYESNGVDFCARCAPGYIGYPNCTLADPDTDRPVACAAPLLPLTLDGPGYLGFNAHTHISGEYYVDLFAKSHDTQFTLSTASALRVYVEPHWVDIDVYLFHINDDGSSETIELRLSFNYEETLYRVLPPGKYQLTFRYYVWSTTHADASCETFLLELAIAPVDSLISDTPMLSQYCQPNSVLPATAHVDIKRDYSLKSATYSVNSNANKTATDNYFWNMTFTITPPGDSQVASLTASLGYHFLTGDLSILLEAGTVGDHLCSSFFNPNDFCVYGQNDYNNNVLHTLLRAGTYTLWIYEPVRQNATLSACSAFDFSFDVTFLDAEEDIFSCDGSPVPASLNNAEFRMPDGSIHFVDHFLMNGIDPNTTFDVATSSLFRVAVVARYTGDVSLRLENVNTKEVIIASNTSGTEPTIFATLPVGSYRLHFISHLVSPSSCPFVRLEFALEPASNMSVACPVDGRTTSPVMPPQLVAPYRYSNSAQDPQLFYAFYNSNTYVVAEYSFTITQTTVFETRVSSNFLRSDLRLKLFVNERSSLTLLASGYQDYNSNAFMEELNPGGYTLQIVRPPTGNTPISGSSCSPYNFDFYLGLVPSSGVCVGEVVPSTFNSLQFLSAADTMHYQSSNFVVPHNITTLLRTHDTRLRVKSERMIRVYVEPHEVDIDIALLVNDSRVATGSNGIGPEESFTYILSPNVDYIFRVTYWIWQEEHRVNCYTYNMEISVGPVIPLDVKCPNNGGDFWMPAFPTNMPTSTYQYDSIASKQSLYFQQAVGGPRSYSTTFSLNAPADFHAEVGYDFLRGHVVLKLNSKNTGDIYYGEDHPNHNTLNVANLYAGDYTLTIYEPTLTQARVMGCVFFTFEAFVSPAVVTTRYHKHLPSSLDSIAYLEIGERTHLAGVYTMFDNTEHDSIAFTVKHDSLLRVDCSVADEEEVMSDVQESILAPSVELRRDGTRIYLSYANILQKISAGSYQILFAPTPAMGSGQLDVEVELAIDTVAHIQADISEYGKSHTCTDTLLASVTPNSQGHYQDYVLLANVSYSTLSTAPVVQNLPFYIDRTSRILVQITSHFLTTDLMLILTSNDADVWIYGRQGRDINEINAEIPAGSYNLQIYQPEGTLFVSSLGLNHCGEFEFSIIVRDAGGDITPSQCGTLDLTPWQLDNINGGSYPYGGPINGSTLHLFGPSFYIPPSTAKASITFHADEALLISVFTGGASATGRIDYQLLNNSAPIQNLEYSKAAQRLAIYYVPTAQHNLDLIYRVRPSVKCPSYALQIDLKPVRMLINELACTSTTVALPTITINSAGFSNEFLSSFVPASDLEKNAPFSRALPLQLTRSSFVTLSIEFNSMVSAFNITVYKKNIVGNTTVESLQATGQWEPQAKYSGATTLTNTFYATLGIGNYTLYINHPPLLSDSPLKNLGLCFPFIWTSSIIPIGQPYVSTVSLSSASNINPYLPFSIVVTFSTVLYSPSVGLVQRPQGSSVVASAFYLLGNDDTEVSPSSASGISADNRQWGLVFNAGVLRSGTTYTLKLREPAVLFGTNSSSSTDQLYLSLTHVYSTIDTTCGGRGVFDQTSGVCICHTAYAGVMCSVCAANFSDISEHGGIPVCVARTCRADTCGCMDSNQPVCTPRGNCYMTSAGVAACQCAAPFDDATMCGTCNAGYEGVAPNCRKMCEPACENGGMCNTEAGVCECPKNFAGSHCESCAADYSGDGCKEYKAGGDSWSTTRTFLGITAAILVVAGAAVAAVWYIRRRGFGGRYKLLPRFDDDDDDDASPLPSYDNHFGDEEAPRFNTDNIGAALAGTDVAPSSPPPPSNNINSTITISPPSPSLRLDNGSPSNAFSINDDREPNPSRNILDM